MKKEKDNQNIKRFFPIAPKTKAEKFKKMLVERDQLFADWFKEQVNKYLEEDINKKPKDEKEVRFFANLDKELGERFWERLTLENRKFQDWFILRVNNFLEENREEEKEE